MSGIQNLLQTEHFATRIAPATDQAPRETPFVSLPSVDGDRFSFSGEGVALFEKSTVSKGGVPENAAAREQQTEAASSL